MNGIMKVEEVLTNIVCKQVVGDNKIEIDGLTFDSRKAKKGEMFFAIKGVSNDGHAYIDDVVRKGIRVIVCESLPNELNENICYVQVESVSKAMGFIASNFYKHPSSKLNLVGVTGTNGKTTTVTLLYHLFRKLGYKVGLLSTIAIYINEEMYETTHTTPDSITINKLLALMVDEGCEYCFMEVSSHSVIQDRIAGLNFRGGVFSNITHDHLDYHKTFDEYIRAKKAFFDHLPPTSFALVNTDDRNGKVMVQNTKAVVKTYALMSPADYMCRILEHNFSGMQMVLNGMEVWMQFVGRFNAYNLAAVFAVADLLGADKLEILTILSSMGSVAGRFESIRLNNGVVAIVDYAHTPDALLNVLNTINEIRSSGKLFTVVGCGGNRDKTKRPEMARIGKEHSDKLIITSDNPRFEKPEDIIDDMKAGLNPDQLRQTLCITDRKEAIKTALLFAQEGDIILIAGKGHETYQDVLGVKIHFDDREIVKELGNN